MRSATKSCGSATGSLRTTRNSTTPMIAMAMPMSASPLTKVVASRLRAMGIGRGDRVVAYMPNLPETVIAMLATTAIGTQRVKISLDPIVFGVGLGFRF